MKAARVTLNDAQDGKSQDGSPLKGRIFKCKFNEEMTSYSLEFSLSWGC